MANSGLSEAGCGDAEEGFRYQVLKAPPNGFYYVTTLIDFPGASVGNGILSMEIPAEGTEVMVPCLPPLQIQATNGYYMDAIVSFIEVDTGRIFLQLKNESDTIIKMSEQLQKNYNSSTEKMLINPYKGQICATKYSGDEQWYRAAVIDRPDPIHVKVFFVDYGNTELVKKTHIYYLQPEFAKIPPMAVKVMLSGVKVAEVLERIPRLMELGEGREVTFKIEGNTGQCFLASIFLDQRPNTPVSLVDVLLDRKVILSQEQDIEKKLDPTVQMLQQLSMLESNNNSNCLFNDTHSSATPLLSEMSMPESNNNANCLSNDTHSSATPLLSEAAAQVDANVQREIEKNLAAVSVEKPEKLGVESSPEVTELSATDSAESLAETVGDKAKTTQTTGGKQEIPSLEYSNQESVHADATVVESPDLFWIVPREKADEYLSKIESLLQVVDKWPLLSPKPGDYCLAEWESAWYRGKILGMKDGKFTVRFVDYGNEDEYEAGQLFGLHNEELAKMPALAVQCGLTGVAPRKGKWSDRSVESLSRFMKVDQSKEKKRAIVVQVLAGNATKGYKVIALVKGKSAAVCLLEKKHAVDPISLEA